MRTYKSNSILRAVAALSIAATFLNTNAEAATSGGCGFQHWVASWAASPSDSSVPLDATGVLIPSALNEETLRMVITPHLSGSTVRVHLTNRFGNGPAKFGAVTLGLQTSGASIASAKPVTFNGSSSVTVQAGQDVVSDPVAFNVTAFTPLAVSMYMPGLLQGPITKHWNANATSYYSLPLTFNLTKQTNGGAFIGRSTSWFYVDGLDVLAGGQTRSVVAFGDSITDGWVAANALSIPASAAVDDLNGRYPDDLQRRLNDAGIPISVINAGIGSNQLLAAGTAGIGGPSGLSRLSADALSQAGVSGVLLLEGINDLGISQVTAEQLIDGYKQFIAQVHAAGLPVWLGTITPASNALVDGVLIAPQSDSYRQQINTWIRSQTVADGVVDFDAAIRDPSNPSTLLSVYAGPDNLHPNLAGYSKMAAAVNLGMLAATACH
ncbi:MAG TPA: GDSL-type esterase/lipase family protein [Spongiibacteraceae bacterium]